MDGQQQRRRRALAAAFIAGMMRRFDLGDDRWAFHALHDRGQCYGMSEAALTAVLREAALIFNLHGGTMPRPEHYRQRAPRLRRHRSGRGRGRARQRRSRARSTTWRRTAPFFTWGENYGNADCGVPRSDRFAFVPTRQPIVMDLWEPFHRGAAETFTTIANWHQP